MYAQSLESIARKRPLIYVLTNNVTNGFVADVLLAAGCRPIMAVDPREAGAIALKADAVCINTGTPSPLYEKSYSRILRSSHKASTPLVLDFPGAGVSPLRLRIANRLTSYLKTHRSTEWKTLIRGNASEILTLGTRYSRGGTIDSDHPSDEAADQARALLECCHAVSISGEWNITLGQKISRAQGAGSLLTAASGFGCASAALMAAFLTETSAENASLMTAQLIADAVEKITPKGPASLKQEFIDRLYQISTQKKEEKENE